MENTIEITGKTNEMLSVNADGTLKSTCVFYFGDNLMDGDTEVITIEITSANGNGRHPLFDQLLNKDLRIKVEC
jgi:hypothetical protein